MQVEDPSPATDVGPERQHSEKKTTVSSWLGGQAANYKRVHALHGGLAAKVKRHGTAITSVHVMHAARSDARGVAAVAWKSRQREAATPQLLSTLDDYSDSK